MFVMSRSLRPLYEFLIEAFTASELREFVASHYPDLMGSLPGGKVSLAELTTEVVNSLRRNDAVDEALFVALVETRPRLRATLDRLKHSLSLPEPAVPSLAIAAAPASPRLRVMFVAANPSALPELQLSAEARRIEDKLRGTPAEQRVEFRWRWRADAESLLDALFEGVPDVLHFAGHGATNGALLLQALDGSSHPVKPDALAALLGARQRRPRVIMLNACYSVMMARALLPLVDAVIGMRDVVEDTAAGTFAAEFYRAVGHEYPLQVAFDTARAALRVHNLANDDVPQLDVRGIDPRTYRLI